MKILLIHGQNHKGSTYHIAHQLTDQLNGDWKEYFLPRDFHEFCVGCTQCFMKSETLCPHYQKLKPIVDDMDACDILILTSPVYVYHCTGAMKAFLDHFGYQWIIHRPKEVMFSKKAVVVTTAAGAGMKSCLKDMADSLSFWGIPKIYKLGFAIHAVSYSHITRKTKKKIEKKVKKISKHILNDSIRTPMKTKFLFYLMRYLQKHGKMEQDKAYWIEKGWHGNSRPWRQS